jgi:uncharacterized RDD family membrane protein YckC
MTTTTNNPPPEPADIARRIFAAVIDIAILVAVFICFIAVFGDWDTATKQPGDDEAWLSFSIDGTPVLALFVVIIAYHWLLEALTGRTLGKLMAGLRVVGLNGSSYGLGRAFLRNLLRIVDVLPAFYLVGFIVMVTNKNRQRIGDLASGTVVTRA